MEKLHKCIVKNEKFEVEYFEDYAPANCVLTIPNTTKTKMYRYEMTNGIKTRMWLAGVKGKCFTIYYGENILKELSSYNMKSIADYLNMFNNFSKIELEEFLLDLQKKEKSQLELEIEVLKLKKEALEDEMRIYLEINKKKNEIKELLLKLEE